MSLKAKIGIGALALLVLALLLSPFRKAENNFVLAKKITINKPAKEVYTYLGNSATASDWSMFVDHITPLNPDKVADGKKGLVPAPVAGMIVILPVYSPPAARDRSQMVLSSVSPGSVSKVAVGSVGLSVRVTVTGSAIQPVPVSVT